MVTATADALNSPALPVLCELEGAGVRFHIDGEQVFVSPRDALTPQQREIFLQHREAVRVLVAILNDKGVQDRRNVFRGQLETAPASMVPVFLYRAGTPYVKGMCFSCGDALGAARFARCWCCSLAWRLACRLPIPVELATALDAARVA